MADRKHVVTEVRLLDMQRAPTASEKKEYELYLGKGWYVKGQVLSYTYWENLKVWVWRFAFDRNSKYTK